MCNHIYNVVEIKDGTETKKKCEWRSYYQILSTISYHNGLQYKDLPCDKKGKCLFHSEDLEWKRANKFFERFYELCEYWKLVNKQQAQESALYFHDCHFVGIESDFKYKFENTTSFGIYVENFILKNDILFFDCVFHDTVYINRGLFKEGITLDNCVFKQDIDLMDVLIGKDLNLAPENVFYGKIQLTNVRLLGKFDCIKNTFKNIFDFNYVNCYEDVLIDTSLFENNQEYVSFSAHFQSGISCRSNIFNGLLKFDESVFESDSLFYDNEVSIFHIQDSEISGNIAFVGTEDRLLFTPNSIINLDKDNFKENGRLIFDYCNILNLGNDFVTRAKEFENYQLVTIRETCKVFRLIIIREYPYNYVNDYIVTDLSNLIIRFFKYYFSVMLYVEIVRDEKKALIKLILKTTDNITEEKFNEIMYGIKDKFSAISRKKIEGFTNPQEKDFVETYKSILNRLSNKFGSQEISIQDITSILTLQGLLSIEEKEVNMFVTNVVGDGNVLIAGGSQNSISAPINISIKKDINNTSADKSSDISRFFDKKIDLLELCEHNQVLTRNKNISDGLRKLINEIKLDIDSFNIVTAFEKIDKTLEKTHPYIEVMRRIYINGNKDFDFCERFKLCVEFVITQESHA